MRVSKSLLAAFVLVVTAGAARGETVRLTGFETQFSADALGGIVKVVRFAVSRPDRSETAIRMFSAPAQDGGLPVEVSVLGPGGDVVKLGDSEGADCTLQRTELFRDVGHVIAVMATRVFDAGSLARGLNAPAPLTVQVFRLRKGQDDGESPLVFEAAGGPTQVKPGCRAEAFDAAIGQAAGRALGPGR